MPNAVAPYTPIVAPDRLGYIAQEATYDTAVALAASQSFAFEDLKITPERKFIKGKEAQGTQSLQFEVESFRGGKWECTVYAKTTGLGNLLNYSPLLTSTWGSPTVVGGTSVQYGPFVETSTQPPSMQICQTAGNGFYEGINGAIVETCDIEDNGGGEIVFKFAGSFASYCKLDGNPQTAGNYAATTTTIVLTAGSANKIVQSGNARPNIAFGTENNSGLGYAVTSVAADGVTITISPGLANPVNGSVTAVNVISYGPAWTNGGSVVAAINGNLTIGGTSVGFVACKFKIKTGYKAEAKEGSTNRPRFAARVGMRDVETDLIVYALDENVGLIDTSAWGPSTGGNTTALVLRIGPATAGSRVTFTIGAGRFNVAPIPLKDGEAAMYHVKSADRQNAAHGDEITALWN